MDGRVGTVNAAHLENEYNDFEMMENYHKCVIGQGHLTIGAILWQIGRAWATDVGQKAKLVLCHH